MAKMLGAAGGSVNSNFLGWANLLRSFDEDAVKARTRELLKPPLPHGEL